MDNTDIRALQYVPFDSFIDPSFWHKFSQIKLDVDKLEEKLRPIWGYYSVSDSSSTSSELRVDGSSFNREFSGTRLQFAAHGTLVNKNTIESFKEEDKTALLEQYGRQVWADIVSGAALDDPTLLSRFIILSYADLKKYKFYSWFGFPAPNFATVTNYAAPASRLEDVLNPDQVANFTHQLQNNKDWRQRSCFTLRADGNTVTVGNLRELATSSEDTFVVFPEPLARGVLPGWPLRNLLALVSYHCAHLAGRRLRCVGLRTGADTTVCATSSRVYDVIVPACSDEIKWVGWERNQRGKFGPRMFDLQASMSPAELAETAVDLNLKLMKWRLCPGVDLDAIRDTRCLLLGAGTLGCSVARNLMAWGVHRITLADNGTVSYSNPVRQSLYTHTHCLHGGEPKAAAAARSLADIFPGVAAEGVVLNIPMPGHPIGASLLQETVSSVETLERLIDDHDAVFLLMDSRESRWLPTLMAASKGKIAMNAALGFDTYLVMRHGTRPRRPIESEESTSQPIGDQCSTSQPIAAAGTSSSQPIPGDQLGCYFCNDVTAPGNSQADRSLDQQCTVARPGVSGIAAALVVELFVSLLQHPDKAGASADCAGAARDSCVLGSIPHTVRGFLSQYQQVLPSCRRFGSCIACSDKVLAEYETRGFDFLEQVFNTPNYLEDITGLTQMKAETADTEIWELESDSSSGDMD